MSVKDFEVKLQDPLFVAQFLVNPKEALAKANIKLESEEDIKRVEVLARFAQKQLASAAELTNFSMSLTGDWGVGAGCCNKFTLFGGRAETKGR